MLCVEVVCGGVSDGGCGGVSDVVQAEKLKSRSSKR